MANRNVRSNFIIYDNVIRNLEESALQALIDAAGALQTEVIQGQVIPRDTGQLQGDKFHVDNSNINEGEADLAFEGPYARRLYYHPEYKFQKTENPNAKGKWMEDWMEGGSKCDEVKNIYAECLRRRIGI